MVHNNKTYKIYLVILITLVFGLKLVNAQSVSVNAKLDTTDFLIGDQVGLELSVTQPVNVFVGIPVFDTEINKEIEILEQSENDTSILKNGDWLIKKQLLITAFDSGYYALPPIPVVYYSDTIKTEPLLFRVHTVAVDTSQAIKDIKMPYAAPISFAEMLPWAGGGIGAILIILLLVYIIRKIRRKEPIIKWNRPKEPAHLIALRDLNKIKLKKLWQKDKVKEYYTELTDIIRKYLWNRYSIRTMERTSDEILASLKNSEFKDVDLYNLLKDILKKSDLVKFAKFKPLADENVQCLDDAFEFVDKTKLIVEEKDAEEEQANESSESKDEVKVIEEKIVNE